MERSPIKNIAHKTIFSLILMISACSSSPSRLSSSEQTIASVKPEEGEWINEGGIAISEFRDGIFSTTATDTEKKIASGHYTHLDTRTITIKGISLIRQTPIAFNCLLVTELQMNCSNTKGQHFILKKKRD